MEGSVGDEPVLIGEGVLELAVGIVPREPKILQLGFGDPVWIQVGVDPRHPSLIRAIQIIDSVPYFSLDLQIIFEIVDDLIISSRLSFLVIFVQLRIDILR